MSPATHYRHSGRVSLLLFPLALAFAGALTLVAALVYAYAMVYVPVVQLAFLLPLLYGAGMGALIAWMFRRAKVRSVVVTVGAAIVLTGISYGLSWIPWAYATLARAEVDVTWLDVLFPPSFVAIVVSIYETGAWSIGTSGGAPVSGVMLGVCWAFEAVFVLAAAPIAAYGVASVGVFCEKCERWCKTQPGIMFLAPHAQGDLALRLDAQDFRVLAEAPRADPTANPVLRLDLDACDGCGETNTLTLVHVTRTQQKNREQLQQHVVVDKVLAARDHVQWMLRG